jgi:hypothetical protein
MAKKKATTGTIIDKKRAGQYHVDDKTRTPSGRKSIDSNDKVAKALRGKSLDEVIAIAKKNDIDVKKYAHLNAGMQRMNIGNKLRGLEEVKGL